MVVFKAFKSNTASALTSMKDLVTSSATSSYESEESQRSADNGANLLSKNIANQTAVNNANIINQTIDIINLKILPKTYEEMKYTVKFPFPYDNEFMPFLPPITIEDFTGLNITYKRINLGSKQSIAPFSTVPDNTSANHGGLVLYGAKDHYLIYDLETSSWLSSDNINLGCDLGILSCDKKILDKYNVIVGTNCVKGQINFGGDGGFNNWRMNVDDSNNLKVSYRRSDGYLVEQTLAYAPLDPVNDAIKNNGTDWFTEKRELPYENKYYNIDTELNNVTMDLSKTLRYNNMYYKSYNDYSEDSKKLSVSLRLCSEQTIVGGRYMSNGSTYNGFFSGPLVIVRPGDTLEMDIMNRDFGYADLDPYVNTPSYQFKKMYHQHVVPYDATYPDHTSYITHMAHSMVGPITNNHFHGFEGSPSGLSDNVLRSAKPNSSLLYRYEISSEHPGGPYWYHPHIHGNSVMGVGRGSAGLIYVEGPYQNYLERLGIRREIVQLQKLLYKNRRDQSELTWFDLNFNEFPTDVYNVDACNNAIPPTVFHPVSHYPACANSNDYGSEGTCGCDPSSRTILNGLKDGFNSIPEEVDMSITENYLLNAQIQPVFSIHPNELKMFTFCNTMTDTMIRISIDHHYMVNVGKDGHPSVFSSFQTSGLGIDTDGLHRPPGIFLDYIIIGPGERFELFIIPKQGLSTSKKTYNINSLPIESHEHSGLFANDKNEDYFYYTGFAKVANIVIGTLSYDQNYIDLNATNNISNFLTNSEIYNPNYNDVINTNPNQNIKMNEYKDFNLLGYLQERHIKDKTKLVQSFKITDISYVTGFKNATDEDSFNILDPSYNVVQIILDTSNKKHFFSVYDGRNDPEGVTTVEYDADGNNTTTDLKIQINNVEYSVFAVPFKNVYDDSENDISTWVFYIKDTDKSIYNTLINIPDEQKIVSYNFYTIETQSVPILKSEFDNINKHTVTTKYAHRLTKDDVFYFHYTTFIVDEVLSYNIFTFISDKTDPIHGHTVVLFDTYNIRNEFLYLYSKEIYTNNNTYKTTQFYDNNGPTFDINNVDTFSTLEENINSAFYDDPNDVLNSSYFYTKICERRNVTYSFAQIKNSAVIGESAAEIDGKMFHENIVNTMLTNINCEWIIDNHTGVIHYHHQHVNSVQVCGYNDEGFGFNITPNRMASYVDPSNNYIPGDYPYHITYDSTFNYITNTPYDPTVKNPLHQENEYRFQNEIVVPFQGYEDTVLLPLGLGSTDTGIVDAPYGTRGRTRLRFHNNKHYLGKLVNHCHLLLHQDQGMMKPVEYVGIDPVTNDYYYPCPDLNLISNDGIKTDFYNNVWTTQHSHSHEHTDNTTVPHPVPVPVPVPPTIDTTDNRDHSNQTH
jgi:FtsP/CotA-like multicopper oxidase with cupredoxin domain